MSDQTFLDALAAHLRDLERRQMAANDPDLRSDLARRAADARAQLAAANAVVRAMERETSYE